MLKNTPFANVWKKNKTGKKKQKQKKQKNNCTCRLAQEVMTQKSIFTSLFVIGGENIRVIILIF